MYTTVDFPRQTQLLLFLHPNLPNVQFLRANPLSDWTQETFKLIRKGTRSEIKSFLRVQPTVGASRLEFRNSVQFAFTSVVFEVLLADVEGSP